MGLLPLVSTKPNSLPMSAVLMILPDLAMMFLSAARWTTTFPANSIVSPFSKTFAIWACSLVAAGPESETAVETLIMFSWMNSVLTGPGQRDIMDTPDFFNSWAQSAAILSQPALPTP